RRRKDGSRRGPDPRDARGIEASDCGDEVMGNVEPAPASATAKETMVTLRIWRGDGAGGKFEDYVTPVADGMVVLDAVHRVQANQANDLAVRWNCKAGKCGSCSAEINGKPRLMCMTQLADMPPNEPIVIEPMRAFPHLKDLVTDVSWNYRVKQRIKAFKPRPPDAPDGT